MKLKHVTLNESLYQYLVKFGTPPDDVLQYIEQETAKFDEYAIMSCVPEQGAMLTILCRLIRASKAIEVGTFTGFSSVCIARGLSEGGRLLCCDIAEDWTKVARKAWDMAGLTDSVELRISPALETIKSLPKTAEYDLAFIDADKVNYWNYFEEIVSRVRTNGLIVIDNTLFQGEVNNPNTTMESARIVDEFNRKLAIDSRVDVVILPIHDGVTLARKR